ncbi:hypothetical protein D0B54_04490 [Solimonas sp. K1W22B-7]|nr:hypothetical protein D0B54_04490 [Solimonas sp. K1W22B-7]
MTLSLTKACASALTLILLAACCTERFNGVEAQWQAVLASNGCMMGHQDWTPSGGREGWGISPCWDTLLKREQAELIPFLVGKLSSRKPAGIHVDPFDAGIEGEIALYALQHATHRNWYEYDGKNPIMAKAVADWRQLGSPTSAYGNTQILIQEFLDKEEARKELVHYFGRP